MLEDIGSRSAGPSTPTREEEDLIIENALKKDPIATVVKAGGIDLNVRSLKRLRGQGWLFGDTVEGYFRMFADVNKTVGVLSSYLWIQLSMGGPDRAMARNRKSIKNVRGKELVLIPIHLNVGSHWIMVAVYLNKHEIHIYDSYTDRDRLDVGEPIKDLFLRAELFTQCEVDIFQKTDIPKQTNNYDCGVFVCRYAKCLILGMPMDFTEKDMPKIRKEMLRELVFGRLPSIVVNEETSAEELTEVERHFEPAPVATNQESIDFEKEKEFSDKADKEESKDAARLYQPPPLELELLRKGNTPFLDIDDAGHEFTAKAGGDWRKMLKLSEVLASFSSEKDEAWSALYKKLEEEPGVALKWLRNSGDPMVKPTPFQFRFGKFANVQRIRKFLEKEYPFIMIEQTHKNVNHHKGKRNRLRCMEARFLNRKVSKPVPS